MELKDTIEMMTSPDYKERFKAEYYQLKTRYEKLNRFFNLIEVADMTGTKPPAHDCPVFLLREQFRSMGQYLSVLEHRAIIEHIDL